MDGVRSWLGNRATDAYERLLEREISGTPTHVAIIQDGNRRYARNRGADRSEGHEAGAETTEQVLEWCEELDIEELTLYAFSTENFNREPAEREYLFDLIEAKLWEFADADRVHEDGVRIRAIGEIDRLPERVREAVAYAESNTREYGQFRLNVALAYGGRNELLRAARDVSATVDRGELAPEDIDVAAVEKRLYDHPVQDVDLIVRTGGDERTSNFLPWYANGNEAAVFFCAPYWPEFSKVDFLRAIRTFESREASWRRTRAERAVALVRAVASVEIEEARAVARRLRETLPAGRDEEVVDEFDVATERPNDPAD
jgi:tritrans,polycis-undecaprenyl-diphosphate synthase [geranylgeranyl-diphosphate specific]